MGETFDQRKRVLSKKDELLIAWDECLSSLQFTKLEIVQQKFPNAIVQAWVVNWVVKSTGWNLTETRLTFFMEKVKKKNSDVAKGLRLTVLRS